MQVYLIQNLVPSGKHTKKLLNMPIYSWFTNQKWLFSIVMFVYQRADEETLLDDWITSDHLRGGQLEPMV